MWITGKFLWISKLKGTILATFSFSKTYPPDFSLLNTLF